MSAATATLDSEKGPAPSPDSMTVCVFCGASPGDSPTYMAAARSLAHAFHKHGITMVYGGGANGLMGEISRTLVSLSGPDAVHGVMVDALVGFERNHVVIEEGLVHGHIAVVPDMHTRKQRMASYVMQGAPGSGFVALPGGYGTMEEFMEVVTWNQLGIHARGLVVYNVDGFFDGLLAWVRRAVDAGFVRKGNANMIVEAKTAEEVVQKLRDYEVATERFGLSWDTIKSDA
ncbi:hypothetical protein BOTBODRAFT_70180 [Botryobasidium botryosum FD-172 SS1]|uniref:Cytokinin riboside 5'-monophosphate phosphoribohydrolase n=1 Tax=Botryobasidium botryosum (strain FD-172 SS1) TaxID=930990 RepID=A0A067LZN9_BOTB1|nr:hypothetical protein BOTBODRAFT_70180 [Botryobasidium botryosum FD-172 SS1]